MKKGIRLEKEIEKNIEKCIKRYDSKKIPYQKFHGLILSESQRSHVKDFYKSLISSNGINDIKKVFEAFKREINENLSDNNQIAYLNNAGGSIFLDEDAIDNDDEFDIGNYSDSNMTNYDTSVEDNTFSYDDDLGKTHAHNNFGDASLEDQSNDIQLDENLVNDDYLVDVGSNSFDRVNEEEEFEDYARETENILDAIDEMNESYDSDTLLDNDFDTQDALNEDEMNSTLDNATSNSTLDNDYNISTFQQNFVGEDELDESDDPFFKPKNLDEKQEEYEKIMDEMKEKYKYEISDFEDLIEEENKNEMAQRFVDAEKEGKDDLLEVYYFLLNEHCDSLYIDEIMNEVRNIEDEVVYWDEYKKEDEDEDEDLWNEINEENLKFKRMKNKLNEEEDKVEYVDKPSLFSDLVSVENNMSDAFNSLYPYKFEYIDDPRIKKALRQLRVNISDTLTKINSLISMVGLEKDLPSDE